MGEDAAARGRLGSPILLIALARLREMVRQPSLIFWVFAFPPLLSLGLGLAFRNRGAVPPSVAVLAGPRAEVTARALVERGLGVQDLDEAAAAFALRSGTVALVVTGDDPPRYRFDPTRPEARLARALADHALQSAAGRRDALAAVDEPVVEPGGRYIDFLVPGLIGMNLMAGSMWGVGAVVVQLRGRRILKRLRATPMRRRDLFAGHALARLAFVAVEVTPLLVFGHLAFGTGVRGSLLLLALVAVIGATCFAGLALLLTSRVRNVEAVGGILNVAMLPMVVGSGIFFSAANFPAAVQPLLRVLPLTALNDALRGVAVDGASLAGVAAPLGILSAWAALGMLLGTLLFRWD